MKNASLFCSFLTSFESSIAIGLQPAPSGEAKVQNALRDGIGADLLNLSKTNGIGEKEGCDNRKD